ASDGYGNANAIFRRLGLMYVIWNQRICDPVCTAYNGTNPHTDHIHFSFSWPGAWRQTTFWRSHNGFPRKLGDYTNDNRADLTIWRQRGSTWWIKPSPSGATIDNVQW